MYKVFFILIIFAFSFSENSIYVDEAPVKLKFKKSNIDWEKASKFSSTIFKN